MRAMHSLALLLLMLLLDGCTSTSGGPPRLDKGDLSFDGLARVENPTAGEAWMRPDFTLAGYGKIMLVGAGIEFRPVPRRSRTAFPVTEAQQKRLTEIVATAFRSELAKSTRFQLTDTPGPDVLTIRGALIDVVSRVPPETLGRSNVYLRNVGEATLVIEISDSESNAPLVRIVDRRAAGRVDGFKSNSASNWSEVRLLARTWAKLLATRLDAAAEWDQ